MRNYEWIEDPENEKNESCIRLISDISMSCRYGSDTWEEDGYWYYADIRWDGCIHFNHAGNIPFGNKYKDRNNGEACDSYYHICDIDELIERLITLRNEARNHFGEDWGK